MVYSNVQNSMIRDSWKLTSNFPQNNVDSTFQQFPLLNEILNVTKWKLTIDSTTQLHSYSQTISNSILIKYLHIIIIQVFHQNKQID